MQRPITEVTMSQAASYVNGELVNQKSSASVTEDGEKVELVSQRLSDDPMSLLHDIVFHPQHELDLVARLHSEAGLPVALEGEDKVIKRPRSNSRRTTRARRHIVSRKRRRSRGSQSKGRRSKNSTGRRRDST